MCNFFLSNQRGEITSRNFPGPYQHMDNCRWTLTPWQGHSMRLIVHNLDILPTWQCKTEYLKLSTGHFPHQERLCGHHFNITYVTEEPTLARFRSRSGNLFHTGFRLTYEQVPQANVTEFERNYVIANGNIVHYKDRHWIPSR